MVSLKQLQAENARLKKMGVQLRMAQRDNEDRRNLLRENKKLARDIKFGKQFKTATNVARVTKAVGKKAGKDIAKVGIVAFRGLRRYGRFLQEQERKQKRTNRKLKSAKKTRRK